MNSFRIWPLSLAILFTANVSAASTPADSTGFDPLRVKIFRQPERPLRHFLPQFASLVLPGFDQWWEQQNQAAIFYSGLGYGALTWASIEFQKIESGEVKTVEEVDEWSPSTKRLFFAAQTYQVAGSLSAYHSFKTAVKSHKDLGTFSFITTDEEPKDVVLAPFQFHFLKRPTTWVPLGLLLGGSILYMNTRIQRDMSFEDDLYHSALSYNAGVGEEALFRGWVMPSLMANWGNAFWVNNFQATIFALAHLSDTNRDPWPQFLMGWYWGWLTQRNGWSVSESVFIHAWWDVIAFAAVSRDGGKKAQIFLPLVSYPF